MGRGWWSHEGRDGGGVNEKKEIVKLMNEDIGSCFW